MYRNSPEKVNTEIPPLPPYTYVPGVTAHPVSGPDGHMASGRIEVSAQVALAWGRRLFNHGYYWEAHEIWESGWIALGRRGAAADLFKGLIKLAACGVKCLEGNRDGAVRHARGAGELFLATHSALEQERNGPSSDAAGGLDLPRLARFAAELESSPPLASELQRKSAAAGGVPLLKGIGE